jgi:formylglycine-generating enzyme required for sulfatase activity
VRAIHFALFAEKYAMKYCITVSAFLLLVALTASTSLAVTISTVPVGDVGNPNDPATGNLYGGVNYVYNIGTYEVTVRQYTAFLNAVAATDTNALYNPSMATNLNIAGISRSGASGSYTYSVIGSPNHPVTYVSWYDSVRFANWLHNGQPSGPQNSSTTEDGAYTLSGTTDSGTPLAFSRNAGARWVIPTESEWYKAAYCQPAAAGGDSDGYWAYPMKTNSQPYSAQPPGTTPDNTRVGNFLQNDGLANGYDDGHAVTGLNTYSSSQNYLTDVGAYTSSPSYYGTFDQGGNVYEWNELTPDVSFYPVDRGGSWGFYSVGLLASNPASFPPSDEYPTTGFRVASVPEPASITLCLAGACILALGRGRKAVREYCRRARRCRRWQP